MPRVRLYAGGVRHAAPVALVVAACVATGLAHADLGEGVGIGRDLGVASLTQQIDAGAETQQRLDADARALETRNVGARATLVREVRALYRLTRPGAAPLAAGFDALRVHVARVKRLERLVSVQVATIAGLAGTRQHILAERQRVQAEVSEARDKLDALGAQRDATAPTAASVAAVGITLGGGDDDHFYGLRIVDGPPLDAFEQRKGDLASPVTGEVRVVDAQRRDSTGPGLEFQATAGTPVRTVASGRVAFSDRRDGYGRLVMLDHGEGFFTVYGGLGGVEVLVGDDLSEGARIGSIGGDTDPPALYFEVRRGERALPPRAWLGF